MKPTPYRGPSSQFSAEDHIARARQFRRGAHKLEDMEGAEPNWPKYALLGHAVELERFSVDVNRNSKGVPKGAQIRFGLL
jgi:hypothetical protein